MKPIFFNTEMVRGSKDDRKTQTRRVVRLPKWAAFTNGGSSVLFNTNLDGGETDALAFINDFLIPPFYPGDILYVRETFFEYKGHFYYKADGKHEVLEKLGIRFKWRPSIHMPKEAARLFLRVKSVRVERVQDITDADARKEGCADREDFHRVWNDCYAKPRPVKGADGTIAYYASYPWEDICETRTYRGKPWYVVGNPWVWGIEFERISKEEVRA